MEKISSDPESHVALGYSLLAELQSWTGWLDGHLPPPANAGDWWAAAEGIKSRLAQVKAEMGNAGFSYQDTALEIDDEVDPVGFLKATELYLKYLLQVVQAFEEGQLEATRRVVN